MELPALVETWRSDLSVLGQCVLALVLGGAIGWERERAGKGAGFRTQMLVCLGAMLFGALGEILIADFREDLASANLQPDPLRVTEAVVTGISFIGAGVVLRDRSGQRASGLTTAATMLVVGIIGLVVAAGHYPLACGVTLLVLFILRALARVEAAFAGPPQNSPPPAGDASGREAAGDRAIQSLAEK
jgi:putative Mg2+ transporter-C (MgtC) family protein